MLIDETYNIYDQTSDVDDYDDFLESASIELLEDGISKQFEDPHTHRKQNYIEAFYESYRKTVARLEDMDDEELPASELEDLQAKKEEFLAFVVNKYYDFLSVGIPDFANMSEEDQEEMLDMLYRYFIKDMKKNFTSVVKKYIDSSPDLAERFEERHDVTTASFQGVLSSEDIKLISNIDEIVDMAFNAEYTVDEFIDATMYTNDATEVLFIKDAFADFTLTGNFVSQYIGYTSDFYPQIVAKIRQYIFDKYPDSATAAESDITDSDE